MPTVWDSPDYVKTWNNTYGLLMENDTLRPPLIFPWMATEMEYFAGRRMLDLGCGNGNLIRSFKNENFGRWVGVDGGEAVLKSTDDLKDDKRIEIIHADVCKPLKDLHGKFDVVQSFFVIEEIPPESFPEYWQNIHDCLESKGEAFIVTNHPCRAFYHDIKSSLLQKRNEKFVDHKGYFDRGKTGYALEVMNQKNGFKQQADHYHKNMSDIINGAVQSGLLLQNIVEVAKSVMNIEQMKNHQPASGDIPSLLMMKLKRA